MKNKLLLPGLFLLLMWLLPRQTSAQNSLFIRLSNGTQNSIPLSSLNKITFSSGNMFLKLNDATTNSFTISDIYKMTFGVAAGLSDILIESDLSVYPNPASEFIQFKNIPDGETNISIYRLDGAVVIQKKLSSVVQPIDISGLSGGLYLIKVGSKTLKFTKQ